jgi:hypothetical protein
VGEAYGGSLLSQVPATARVPLVSGRLDSDPLRAHLGKASAYCPWQPNGSVSERSTDAQRTLYGTRVANRLASGVVRASSKREVSLLHNVPRATWAS